MPIHSRRLLSGAASACRQHRTRLPPPKAIRAGGYAFESRSKVLATWRKCRTQPQKRLISWDSLTPRQTRSGGPRSVSEHRVWNGEAPGYCREQTASADIIVLGDQLLYRVHNPSILSAIPEAILPLVYIDPAGPIIVGLEKSAIHFDPLDTSPETANEWEAVADSIGQKLGALVAARLREGEVARFIDGGVWWRHLTHYGWAARGERYSPANPGALDAAPFGRNHDQS